MWAAIATVFVLRDSFTQSVSAAVSRMIATLASFVPCFVYLLFLAFHVWALRSWPAQRPVACGHRGCGRFRTSRPATRTRRTPGGAWQGRS